MREPIDPNRKSSDKEVEAAYLRAQLSRVASLRKAAQADPDLGRERLLLREWQARRLARTHRDLLGSARYGEAAHFFLSDLYGPKDFSARDEELERILPMVVSFLPASGLETLALAIELDALSEQLDETMILALRVARRIDAIDDLAYANAYRACDNRPLREHQIRLVANTGHALDRLAHRPLLAGAIRLMRGPAHAVGLSALHEFLERGFHSFRRMGGAAPFLDAICARESAILECLFAGQAPQFDGPSRK